MATKVEKDFIGFSLRARLTTNHYDDSAAAIVQIAIEFGAAKPSLP
jgi:hypothetical protein